MQLDQQDIVIVTSKKENTSLTASALSHVSGVDRCSSNCLPNIANPVDLFNDMYHESQNGSQLTTSAAPDINIQTEGNINFVPKLATIVKKTPMTALETLFEIKLDDGSELNHKPGQFVEVSVFGIGEAPISLSSSPTKKGTFEICVRKLGNVTTRLHKLNEGDKVGIRGPFGNGFDVDSLKNKDLLFIAGGLGNCSSSLTIQLCAWITGKITEKSFYFTDARNLRSCFSAKKWLRWHQEMMLS